MAGSVFIASFSTETNSFSNIPTTLESFEAGGILRGDDVVFDQGEIRPENRQVAEFAKQNGWTLAGGISASAEAGAPVQQTAYETLRDELLDRLRSASDVQAVVLFLHGAMISTDCFDCEGDVLANIRATVGSNVPIGAVLDPHAHLTDQMVEAADALIFMKEYPHVDGAERQAELLDILQKQIDGECEPVSVICDCELIGFFPTNRAPMSEFVEEMKEAEKANGILSVSLIHGFPWGDTPETGAKILVIGDGDIALAKGLAEKLKASLWSIADQTLPPLLDLDAAIEVVKSSKSRPVIIGDIADNPGGGAPSDSTFILQALIDAGIENVSIGLIHDPEAVRACQQVGVGGQLELRIGGKLGQFSGIPVDLQVEVMGVRTNARMQVVEGVDFPMGDTAWVRGSGIDIVLSTGRIQMYAPDGFRHIGIEPSERDVIVAKSSNHFRAFFSDISANIIDVDTPGTLRLDFASIPFEHLTKPRHPRDHIVGLTDPGGGIQ